MAWRIHDQVVRAVIDNRIPGKVTGSIWLAGRDQPLQLDLKGNAGPDMAGCLLTVENSMTVPDPLEGLATEQRGVCGDMTASRKVKIPAVPLPDWLEAHPAEPLPYVWGNGVYIEWYSERNGRVVVELSGRSSTLSEPQWRLSPAQAADQHRENARAFASFMGHLSTAMCGAQSKDPAAAAANMPTRDGLAQESGDPEQRARIEALKKQVRNVTGQEMLCGVGDSVPLQVQEQFWRRVLEFERCPVLTVRELLARDGIHPPAPDALDDTALAQQLATLIRGLANRHLFLEFTDHLSDRGLYTLLCRHVLNDEIEESPPGSNWNSHVDMSAVGLAEDDDGSGNYLRYYADPDTREQWAGDFPDEVLPPHVDPPYDRDRWLPRPG